MTEYPQRELERASLWKTVRARPRAFLTVAAFVSIVGVLVAFLGLPDVYEAAAVVRGRVPGALSPEQAAERAGSPAVLAPAVADPSSPLRSQGIVEAAQLGRTIEVSASSAGTGGEVELRIVSRGTDSEAAATRVNAVARSFLAGIDAEMARHAQEADELGRKLKAVDDEVARAEDERDRAVEALAAFQAENQPLLGDADRLKQTAQKAREDLEAAERAVETIESKIIQQEGTQKLLQAQLKEVNPVVEERSQTDRPDSDRVRLQRELERMRIELAEMLKTFTDRHPDVVKMKQNIQLKEEQLRLMEERTEDVKTRLTRPNPVYEDIRKKLVDADVELQKSRDALKLQAEKRDRLKERAEVLNGLAGKLTALKQRVVEATENAAPLRGGRERIVAALDMEKAMAGERPALAAAETPREPVGPNRPLWVGLALLAGLVAGLVAARAASALGSRFIAPFEVEAYAGVGVLGKVGRIQD